MLPIPELYILAHLVENEESVLQCYALRQSGEVVSIFPVSNLTFGVFSSYSTWMTTFPLARPSPT